MNIAYYVDSLFLLDEKIVSIFVASSNSILFFLRNKKNQSPIHALSSRKREENREEISVNERIILTIQKRCNNTLLRDNLYLEHHQCRDQFFFPFSSSPFPLFLFFHDENVEVHRTVDRIEQYSRFSSATTDSYCFLIGDRARAFERPSWKASLPSPLPRARVSP